MEYKDDIIFERQINNYRLKKVYDVTVAGSKYRDIDFNSLSKGSVEFKEEKDNEYDSEAIAVYKDDIKLGYMFRGTGLREYVRSSLNSDELLTRADLYYINNETKELRYKLAMYKRLSKDNYHYIKDYSFRLNKTDVEDRNFFLMYTEELDSLILECDHYEWSVVVYNSTEDEIGELSSNDVDKIEEFLDTDDYEVYAYLDIIWEENDEWQGMIKVFVYRPEEDKKQYYDYYESDYEYDDEDNDEFDENEEDDNTLLNDSYNKSDSGGFWSAVASILDKTSDDSKSISREREKENKLNRLKRDYGHVFDYVDKNLDIDFNAVDNEFGYGEEDYEDLKDLEIELEKIKKKYKV